MEETNNTSSSHQIGDRKAPTNVPLVVGTHADSKVLGKRTSAEFVGSGGIVYHTPESLAEAHRSKTNFIGILPGEKNNIIPAYSNSSSVPQNQGVATAESARSLNEMMINSKNRISAHTSPHGHSSSSLARPIQGFSNAPINYEYYVPNQFLHASADLRYPVPPMIPKRSLPPLPPLSNQPVARPQQYHAPIAPPPSMPVQIAGHNHQNAHHSLPLPPGPYPPSAPILLPIVPMDAFYRPSISHTQPIGSSEAKKVPIPKTERIEKEKESEETTGSETTERQQQQEHRLPSQDIIKNEMTKSEKLQIQGPLFLQKKTPEATLPPSPLPSAPNAAASAAKEVTAAETTAVPPPVITESRKNETVKASPPAPNPPPLAASRPLLPHPVPAVAATATAPPPSAAAPAPVVIPGGGGGKINGSISTTISQNQGDQSLDLHHFFQEKQKILRKIKQQLEDQQPQSAEDSNNNSHSYGNPSIPGIFDLISPHLSLFCLESQEKVELEGKVQELFEQVETELQEVNPSMMNCQEIAFPSSLLQSIVEEEQQAAAAAAATTTALLQSTPAMLKNASTTTTPTTTTNSSITSNSSVSSSFYPLLSQAGELFVLELTMRALGAQQDRCESNLLERAAKKGMKNEEEEEEKEEEEDESYLSSFHLTKEHVIEALQSMDYYDFLFP